MKRLPIYLDKDLDKALTVEAARRVMSKAALIGTLTMRRATSTRRSTFVTFES